MPQIVDIILKVKKIRATLSLALQSDLWENYNYSICQIHQLALRTCYSRKDSYWYSSMKDLNSLLLTTETSSLGSNFPFKILIFKLSFSPPPLTWNFQWSWGEHGAWSMEHGSTNLGTLCVHCCLGTHVPQIATWHDSHLRRLMTILLFPFLILSLIFSFLHISSPHPKDNYSVGCMFLILQFALIGPLHSRVFTCAKITLVLALLSLSSSVTL